MDNSIEKRIYDLIASKISGNASAADLEQLERLLSQYPEFRFLNDELGKPAYDADKAQAHAREAYTAHYYSKLYLNLHQEPAVAPPDKQIVPPARTNRRHIARYISIAAVLMAFGIFLFRFYENQPKSAKSRDISEMITQKGSKSKLILPDGTIVVLNADSKLSYSRNFNESSRNVTLTGEAYFDVAHNAARPFIVHTSKATIKVLGTQFNVRDYPGDTRLETSLIKGKVEVATKGPNSKTFTLKPSDKLVIDKTLMEKIKTAENAFQLVPITQVDSVIAETSWVSNKMVYANKPFPEIIKDLERQFDVTILLKSETVIKYKYTGDFEENNIEGILQILKIIKPFDYKIDGKKITIY